MRERVEAERAMGRREGDWKGADIMGIANYIRYFFLVCICELDTKRATMPHIRSLAYKKVTEYFQHARFLIPHTHTHFDPST